MYFFVLLMLKEFLTIFFIIVFIKNPIIQIVPSMLMSLASCLAIAFKKPHKTGLDNILHLITEGAYLLIYILFLSLLSISAVPENFDRRHTLGYLMIALIILVVCRCLVDLVFGILKTV